MTAREQAAFAQGIETARQMALTAAVTIEARDDAGEVRQRAAVAALQGLAEGLRTLMQPPAINNPLRSVFAAIAADPADSETVECPTCKGSLRWRRDSFNGYLSGECKCSAFIQ